MRRRTSLTIATIAAAVAVVAGPITSASAVHEGSLVEATLNGRNEVAAGATDSRMVGDANGRGTVSVFTPENHPTEVCYVLDVEKLGTVTGAHIHRGAAGENGPVVVTLNIPNTAGYAVGCVDLGSGPAVAAITLNRAAHYVNVHTTDFPGGAIRGQLATPTS